MSRCDDYPRAYCDVCGSPGGCSAQGKYVVCTELCDAIAKRYTQYDERIAELESKQQWIPVPGWRKENRAQKCLITNGDWVQIGGEYTGYWPGSTTHEMPLPAPPQEQWIE